jgi:hypothetical protein
MSRVGKVVKFYDSTRASQCEGKVASLSKQAAETHRNRIRNASHFDGADLNVYRCNFCKRWHVGRQPDTWRPQ